jgi:hypothetical protein
MQFSTLLQNWLLFSSSFFLEASLSLTADEKYLNIKGLRNQYNSTNTLFQSETCPFWLFWTWVGMIIWTFSFIWIDSQTLHMDICENVPMVMEVRSMMEPTSVLIGWGWEIHLLAGVMATRRVKRIVTWTDCRSQHRNFVFGKMG